MSISPDPHIPVVKYVTDRCIAFDFINTDFLSIMMQKCFHFLNWNKVCMHLMSFVRMYITSKSSYLAVPGKIIKYSYIEKHTLLHSSDT